MKKHWFNLSFIEPVENGMTYGNGYTSSDVKALTLAQINNNKVFAGVGDRAVLLSCSYLGFMTKEEFTKG